MLELSDRDFVKEVEQSDVPVLVDFWATWCMPCLKLAPVVEELAKHYDGKVKFAKLNVEDSPTIAQKYGIRSIPTLLIFKDGKIWSQIIGVQPKKNLQKKIEEVL